MALNRFSILDLDHAKFGALIKTWALDKKTRPKDIADFKKQLKKHKIKAFYPKGKNTLKTLNLITGKVERLDIRLPPAELIAESEAWLAVNDYPLPRYYEIVFGCAPNIGTSKEERIAFHNARVGDYTVANCA